MKIQPIQTRYRGYNFRSRLEARWAVFFDALGLRWEYEPEGFKLSNGVYYLPDFRVHLPFGTPLWIEIKPSGTKSPEFEQFMLDLQDGSFGTILSEIPDPLGFGISSRYYSDDRPHMWYAEKEKEPTEEHNSAWYDNLYMFCVCEGCDAVGFEFDGRSARIGCQCPHHTGSDKNYTSDHPRIVNAFARARAARFEHENREVWR